MDTAHSDFPASVQRSPHGQSRERQSSIRVGPVFQIIMFALVAGTLGYIHGDMLTTVFDIAPPPPIFGFHPNLRPGPS